MEESTKHKWTKVSKKHNRVWWCTLTNPVLGRMRQEDRRFAASLSYLVRPSTT